MSQFQNNYMLHVFCEKLLFFQEYAEDKKIGRGTKCNSASVVWVCVLNFSLQG